MKRNSAHVIAIMFLTAAFCFAQGEQNSKNKIVLKFNLEPNTSYLSTTEMNQTITQKISNNEQKMIQEMLMTWQYDVLDKDSSGSLEIDLTYKRVKTVQDFGQRKIEYDSDNPPDTLDPSMRAMESLVGDQLTMRISPDGKVTGLKGISEMQQKMIEAMDIPDSLQQSVYTNDLKKQFGEDAIRQSIEQIIGFYPSKPVRVGDSWKSGMDKSGGFPMRIESNYTLKSRVAGVDSIDVSSQIKNNPENNVVKMGAVSMTYNIDGNQTGTILVEENTGLPISSNLNLNFSGSLRMSGMPDQESQTWPISASGTVNVTFEKQ
jgi:hypothetical protein